MRECYCAGGPGGGCLVAECTVSLSGLHVYAQRGPRRAGGISVCLCGAPEPRPQPRHVMSPAEAHLDAGCPCNGSLELHERLTLAADLRVLRQRLANAESTHGFLREESARIRERIGRSALHILDLRARAADLADGLEDELHDRGSA